MFAEVSVLVYQVERVDDIVMAKCEVAGFLEDISLLLVVSKRLFCCSIAVYFLWSFYCLRCVLVRLKCVVLHVVVFLGR